MRTVALMVMLGLLSSSLAARSPRGVLDGVIENLLEGLRPNLTNLAIPDIDTILNATGLSGNLTTSNVTTRDVDTFEIANLKTTLLPLRLDQLVLKWVEIGAGGFYDILALLDIDALKGPVTIAGNGNASLTVYNLTLQIDAVTLNSKGGHLSIKDIQDMSVSLDATQVSLENILEGTDEELGDVVNVFLGFFLTEFINDFGHDVLLALKPTIIEKLDEILIDVHFP